MRTILTVAAAIALGMGAAACGNHNPDITITHQTGAPGSQATGTESAAAATTATTAVTAAPTETTDLVEMTQASLQEMESATRRLATNTSGTRAQARDELQSLKASIAGLAARARTQLPRGDPAGPLIAATDQRLAAAAGRLELVGASATDKAGLLAVAGALHKLTGDIGQITHLVSGRDRQNIATDLQTLDRRLSAVSRGGATG